MMQANELTKLVQSVFTSDGVLQKSTTNFHKRAGQIKLAEAVSQTIAEGGQLVAEAATGVGKTFAYLVPALLSGERILLSTATKTLQDQLFNRDIPRLTKAFGLPINLALLKGRRNYLCTYRLEIHSQSIQAEIKAYAKPMEQIIRWAKKTQTGDLAELSGLDEKSELTSLITSTRENCLGTECPQFKECFVQKARKQALEADLVVINHHLFFADMAIRENGMAELLPTVRTVIFDEAHQLNEIGIAFLGKQLSTSKITDFANDALSAGIKHARGLADWVNLVAAPAQAMRALRLALPIDMNNDKSINKARVPWNEIIPEQAEPKKWQLELEKLIESLSEIANALENVKASSPEIARLSERAIELAELAINFSKPCEIDHVRWLDMEQNLHLVESPLDIAKAVRTKMLASKQNNEDSEKPKDTRERAWIFTSATLGDDKNLTWFTKPCGLDNAKIIKISSPFDYPNQAGIYIPQKISRPNEANHSIDVAKIAEYMAQQLNGKTLVLTTTIRALNTIAEELEERIENNLETKGKIKVLAQGKYPKKILIEKFINENNRENGYILIASSSFWEGVDIAGDALQCVIIDKLPFPPPTDPLVQARCNRLEKQGLSPFALYSLPEAAVALKQGAGRLIRTETDKGLLIICDIRLAQMRYASRLINALPPMKKLQTGKELKQAILELVQRNNLNKID